MKINCFGGKKGPENREHVARCELRIQSIKGKKKRKKLIFFLVRTREREGEEKKKNFSLRSTEFRQSEFVKTRTKVHLLDEG